MRIFEAGSDDVEGRSYKRVGTAEECKRGHFGSFNLMCTIGKPLGEVEVDNDSLGSLSVALLFLSCFECSSRRLLV